MQTNSASFTRSVFGACFVAIVTLLSTSSTVHAAFPGVNGRIVFARSNGIILQIYSMNPDGSDLVNLSDPTQHQFYPSFSADGTRIAFQCGFGADTEICVMNADGSGKIQLTFNTFFDTTPVFSPDGSRIIFASNRDGDSEIFIMNADGTGVVQVTDDPASDFDPTWSPEGTTIAFTRTEAGMEADIIVHELGTTSFTNITNDPTTSDRAADFSPDGTQIAFVSTRDGNLEAYVMNIDGTAVERLTTNLANDNVPAWSPDGRLIVFDSDRVTLKKGDIYTLNADGTGGLTQLTSDPTMGDFGANWQPLATQQVLQNIFVDVQALVVSGALNFRQGLNLVLRLAAANFFINQGNVQAAIDALQSFINQVNSFMSSGVLTLAEGQPLIDDAQSVIDFLSA